MSSTGIRSTEVRIEVAATAVDWSSSVNTDTLSQVTVSLLGTMGVHRARASAPMIGEHLQGVVLTTGIETTISLVVAVVGVSDRCHTSTFLIDSDGFGGAKIDLLVALWGLSNDLERRNGCIASPSLEGTYNILSLAMRVSVTCLIAAAVLSAAVGAADARVAETPSNRRSSLILWNTFAIVADEVLHTMEVCGTGVEALIEVIGGDVAGSVMSAHVGSTTFRVALASTSAGS